MGAAFKGPPGCRRVPPPPQKGEAIMRIRKDTNTQVAVEDYVAGSEDRVVTIVAEW